MRIVGIGLVVLLSFRFVDAAHSRPLRTARQLIIVSGSCENLEAFAVVLRAGECLNKVVNVNFSDGRLDFTFFAHNQNGDAAFSFSGEGKRQIKTTQDDVTQPIDSIIATFGGKTTTHLAAGTCHYSNPFKGKAMISCKADTDTGEFNAIFLTNGKSPDITNLK